MDPLLDDRYRLGGLVGEGGMARVYRADDVALGRTVAIKLMRPGVDGASSERARSEMAVLASLNHPSLVTLYDAALVPNQPEYLVMEFVDGPSLATRLASGPLPPDQVGHFAAELAEALHVVHEAGIVHRDIKPSNVLLSPSQIPGGRPRAKLADFGIAYLLDTARITTPGLVIGTAAYLAPEQLRGAQPAPPADIYSLGLVLLEALTGHRAHADGDGIAAALQRLEAPPAVPASVGPAWARLLEQMLDSDPERRPTAAEVAAAAATALPEGGGSEPQASDSPAAPTAPTVPLADPDRTAVRSADAGLEPTLVLEPAAQHPVAAPPPERRRRLLLARVAGVAAIVVLTGGVVLGFALMNGAGRAPAPGATVPSSVEPSPPGDGPTILDEDQQTEQERKEAEKKAEQERKEKEREQRKQEQEDRKNSED